MLRCICDIIWYKDLKPKKKKRNVCTKHWYNFVSSLYTQFCTLESKNINFLNNVYLYKWTLVKKKRDDAIYIRFFHSCFLSTFCGGQKCLQMMMFFFFFPIMYWKWTNVELYRFRFLPDEIVFFILFASLKSIFHHNCCVLCIVVSMIFHRR